MSGIARPSPSSTGVTVLRGGSILAFAQESHCLLAEGDIAFDGDVICYVGPRWEGPARNEVDVRGSIVLPGFISGGTRLDGGFLDAASPSAMHRSACEAEYGIAWTLARLVRGGVTTIVMTGGRLACSESLALSAGELGMRLYHGPDCADAAGATQLEAAVAFCQRWEGAFDGRVRTVLSTGASVHLSASSARAIAHAAADVGVPVCVSVARSAGEFHQRLRSSGVTPVQWLHQHDLLRQGVLLGDCHFLAGDRATAHPLDVDLPLIEEAGAAISVAPVRSAREGRPSSLLERAAERSIPIALSADVAPWDFLEEMRAASLTCKIALGDHAAGSARSVFDAATLGGATALRRPDIGRLEPGALADMVVVDLGSLRIGPYLDPIRALVSCADTSMVQHVVIGGKYAVRDRRLVAWSERDISRMMRYAGGGVIA